MPDDEKIASAVDAYVRKRNPKLKPVADALRALVLKAAPRSRENINPWGVPTFESNGPFCYMMIGKNHITFGFPRGASLLDSARLLEGTGRNLRHVKLRELSDVHDANLRQLIVEARALNRVQPLGPAMRATKKSAKSRQS